MQHVTVVPWYKTKKKIRKKKGEKYKKGGDSGLQKAILRPKCGKR